MVGPKFLVDTNVFIALEDPKVVPAAVAEFAQSAQLHGVALFLDEACVHDIERDSDEERRRVTQSKLQKFPVLQKIAHREEGKLEEKFGQIKNDNDRCDVLMLDTLDLGIVDFLITEDIGIHKRADRAGLHRRVFTVREALAWLQRTYEPKEFRLPYIESRKAHQVPLSDPLFESLKDDYPEFDQWFGKCRSQHRDCWTVEIGGQLAGLIIRKDESCAEAKTVLGGDRVLKICTFKMKTEYQGEKFGEQLLKKILWFAQANLYNVVYLTVYPKHEFLIELLRAFGFAQTRVLPSSELQMERAMRSQDPQSVAAGSSALASDLLTYPRFYDGGGVHKYIVPILPQFHAILFPEIAELPSLPLFPGEQFLVSSSATQDRTPGNTIRKVYICRSPTRTLKPGDVLLFYLSKSFELTRSQSVTTVGVVERISLATTDEELTRLVGRRSVYSLESLKALQPSAPHPVLVIDFLLNGHFSPHVGLSDLVRTGAFAERPPQSIKRLAEPTYRQLRAMTRMAFE